MMKIRRNFVANSSSSSFIISSEKTLDDLKIEVEIPLSELIEKEIDTIHDMEELKHYFLNDRVNYFAASTIYFDEENTMYRKLKLVHEITRLDLEFVFKTNKVTNIMIQDRYDDEYDQFVETLKEYNLMRREIESGKTIHFIDISKHATWLDSEKSHKENLENLMEKIGNQAVVLDYYEG